MIFFPVGSLFHHCHQSFSNLQWFSSLFLISVEVHPDVLLSIPTLNTHLWQGRILCAVDASNESNVGHDGFRPIKSKV